MFRIIKSALILSIFNIILIYNISFLYADTYSVDTQVRQDFSLAKDDIINITENGHIDGKVTAQSNGNGTVNINTDYNTIKVGGSGTTYETNFGASGSNIGKINVNGTSSTDRTSLYISNGFYANDLNLNNADLTINTGSNIEINNITKTSESTANININYDFGSGTTFGSIIEVDSKPTKNGYIDNLTINNSAKLTIDNNAYINNLTLSDNADSSLNLNSGAKVYGTITSNTNGSGTININSTYDNNGIDTVFGTSSNAIGTLNINNGAAFRLNNTAYINSINMASGTNLTFTSSSTKLIGSISGKGSVNINTDYTATNNDTKFGTSEEKLSNINIGNHSLTLKNGISYVENINLFVTDPNLTNLTIGTGAAVVGTIKGNGASYGIVKLERDYNTSEYGTIFGIEGESINTLNIGSSNTLTLGNLAYTDNLNLQSNSTLNLVEDSGVVGTISGNGIANILKDYTTTNSTSNPANDIYKTNFGISSSSIATINIGQNVNNLIPEISSTLTLNNIAYVNSLNISDTSKLVINQNASVNGIIGGIANSQGTVVINRQYNTNTENTTFGTQNNRLKEVDIINGDAGYDFTLHNAAYIDNLKMNANGLTYTDTTRLFTMTSGAQFNGSITLDKGENDVILGITLNNKDVSDLSDLLSLINPEKTGTSTINSGNEIFLNLVDKEQLIEGNTILLDTGKDYINAGLTYDGIFLNLKLNKSTTNELKLVVEENRTPTLDDVSQAAITSASAIDNWTFYDKSANENTLTSNLQALDSKQDFFHAITNLTPDVSGLNIKMPTQSIISAVANIDKRLNFLRIVKISEKNNTFMKMLSKNMPSYYDEYIKRRNLWWEAFGGFLHQDTKDNIFGYDADYYGGTVGYDLMVNPNFVLGASYTFNLINANDLDYIKSDRDDLKATTHNLDLYFMFYNKWNYLALNVGGGYNMYKQERKINFYNFDKTAKADYNGYSYHADVEYGFNLVLYGSGAKKSRIRVINQKTGKIDEVEQINNQLQLYANNKLNNFIMLTPKVSLTYNNIIIDDYTEKGADAANLIIKTKDYESLDLNAGLSLTFSKAITNTTSFQTILNGYASYGIINNKVELDARYIDDDKTFKVYGFEPNDLTYNAGINFNLNFYDKIDLGLSYNYMFGDGVEGMMLKLSLLYNF